MAIEHSSVKCSFVYSSCFLVLLVLNFSSAQLSSNFYAKTCPKALYTIRNVVSNAVVKEHRMGASLLRLHFHDCFVNASPSSHHLLHARLFLHKIHPWSGCIMRSVFFFFFWGGGGGGGGAWGGGAWLLLGARRYACVCSDYLCALSCTLCVCLSFSCLAGIC